MNENFLPDTDLLDAFDNDLPEGDIVECCEWSPPPEGTIPHSPECDEFAAPPDGEGGWRGVGSVAFSKSERLPGFLVTKVRAEMKKLLSGQVFGGWIVDKNGELVEHGGYRYLSIWDRGDYAELDF